MTFRNTLRELACGLVLGLFLCPLTSASGVDPSASGGQTDPLAPFFRALERLEAGRYEQVAIVVLGDSHTAGDFFTGRLRTLFQDRFGNAGRGTMPAGLPYAGMRQVEFAIQESGRWKVNNSLKSPDEGPYTVSGFVSTSLTPRASMTITARPGEFFDMVQVSFLTRPEGGALRILVDGRLRRTVSTTGPSGEARRAAVRAPVGLEMQIVADSPGTRILDWSLFRFSSGVVLSNLGVNGAKASIFSAWDPTLVQQTLKLLNPSLVVIAYGTNEAYDGTLNVGAFADTFDGVLDSVHKAIPAAALLVVGPPDAARLPVNCKRPDPEAGCGWQPLPMLESVRQVEKDAARMHAAFYWDWANVLLEDGGINAWASADPPLGRPDHIHQTQAGYEKSADILFRELMDRYEAFRLHTADFSSR